MITTDNNLATIRERLAILRYEIELSTKAGYLNIPKYCENLIKDILNTLFGYGLIRLDEIQFNYPGLDLGDFEKKIAYQVTCTKTSSKVKETLRQCIKQRHYEKFKVINIFILTKKQKSYSIRIRTSPFFRFTAKHNIFDLDDLSAEISNSSGDKVKKILQILEYELPGVTASLRQPMWNVPHMRNTFFTGRTRILTKVKSGFKDVHKFVLTQVVSGLGGQGKTQIAVEFAYKFKKDYKFVFWVVADSEITMASGYIEIAKLIGLEEARHPDQGNIVSAVIKWLDSNSGWLLILDNADSPTIVKAYLPQKSYGHILITSRANSFDVLGASRSLQLNAMKEFEALTFLLKRSGRLRCSKDERNYAKKIVSEFGFLPLAIEQAGAFILSHQSKFKDYFAAYKKRKLNLLNISGPVAGNYDYTVATTWSMNFELIQKANPVSGEILRLSAFLSPENIPLELIRDGFLELPRIIQENALSNPIDNISLDIFLKPITDYSLISRDISNNVYNIHRLTQEVIRESIPLGGQRQWAFNVVRSLNTIFPSASFNTWSLCERLLPHAILATGYAQEYNFACEDAGELLNGTACYLRMRGEFEESERIHKISIAVRERDLGPLHPDLATCLNNLALVFSDLLQFEKGIPIMRKALQVQEDSSVTDGSILSLFYNNLGMFYVRSGKYDDGLPLLDKAMELYKNSGEDQPFYEAIILNNFAEYYLGIKNYPKAEGFAIKSLEIREKVGNREKTCRTYVSLADIYFRLGDVPKADHFFQKAMRDKEAIYGAVHPELILLFIRYIDFLSYRGQRQKASTIIRKLERIKIKYKINL